MSKPKEILLRESTRKLYYIAGFVCLASGLLSLFMGSHTGSLMLAIGVMQIVLASRASKNPIIVITRDYLEIKLAPLAGKQFVAFDEIHRVDHEPNKLVLHTRLKQVAIPAKAIDEPAFAQLTRVLKARVG